MITRDNYNKLLTEYGNTSSWAIWARPTFSAKSNTADMSVFDDPDILNILNTGYVFVGLNGSSTHGDQGEGPWKNFHSNYAYQNDFKLRYALMDTPFWGSYITDIIKEYPEVNSAKVNNYLRDNPRVVEENVQDFVKEIGMLGGEKPVLVAMGDSSYEILNRYLSGYYKIVQIKHYSYTIGKEDYRREVLSVLGYEDKIDTPSLESITNKTKLSSTNKMKNEEPHPEGAIQKVSGNKNYDILFSKLSELEREYDIEIKHRSIQKYLNGSNRDILIKNGRETLCGIYVAADKYKIWTNIPEWREETYHSCSLPNKDGYYHYYVQSLDECIKEIRRMAKYSLQKASIDSL